MKIERKDIRILEDKTVEESLDGQRCGFIVNPRVVEDYIELRIVFDLLIPIDESNYVLIKSGSVYIIQEIDLNSFASIIDFLETIIQQSMIHTKRMFQHKHPQYSHINIEIFEKQYFRQEIFEQLTDKGILKSHMKSLGLKFTVPIKDLSLIGVIIKSLYNQVETIALIKEQDHKNYISRKLWEVLNLKEVKPEIFVADVELNHEKSPTLILGFEVNDDETNELYPIVIGTDALAALGIKVDFYLVHGNMSINIPIASPISEN